MFDIHVILQNSPGTLSRLTTLLGRHGIGLEGGGLFSLGEQSHAHFLVEEGERARTVLEAGGIAVQTVSIPLIRRLPQPLTHRAGSPATPAIMRSRLLRRASGSCVRFSISPFADTARLGPDHLPPGSERLASDCLKSPFSP